MRSSFAKTGGSVTASSQTRVDETYDLKGLNMSVPDQIMPEGETPYTTNSRMYARNDGETRVANRTRMGASSLSDVVGEAANVENVAAATQDLPFTTTTRVAVRFSPSSSGALTKLEGHIKKVAGATGHIIVEIYSDGTSTPASSLLAQGSILSQDVTTSYQYLPTRFLRAPTVSSSLNYWAVYYIQDNGSGTYHLNGTGIIDVDAVSSADEGISWTLLGGGARFKTYLSTVGGIKGYHLRYPSTDSKRVMFAHEDKIIAFPVATGVLTTIDSGLDTSAEKVRFAQVDDYSMWVNGIDPARWWNSIDAVADIPNVPSTNPHNIIVWQGRIFLMTDKTKVEFSGLYDFDSWRSVDFFYVPTPKSPDHMTGWLVFQDNLTIFTHETKHVVGGTNISTFTRREAVGTKGAVSQETLVSDRNAVYFMADDKQIYSWNGVTDKLLSERVRTELNGISDPSLVRIDLHNNQLRVYYTKTSGFNDRMLLLDLELDQWFLDTNHQVAGSADLFLDNNELVEFSSRVGAVYYGETQYSDLGQRLDWAYWTNYKTYGSGSAKKRIKRFRPILRTADADYTMLVGKDMDFQDAPDMREYVVSGGGAKWGSFVWGDGTKYGRTKSTQNRSAMSGRGNHIQYRFERSGVDTPVELYGYISQYKMGRAK